jgi:dipeptidyl aminopeptidase/acylaminoacyl peptidase
MKQRGMWWIVAAIVPSAVLVIGFGGPAPVAGPPAGKADWIRKELITTPGRNDIPQFSPEATRIAFQSTLSKNQEIWVLSKEGARPLWRFEGPIVGSPRWSPDGQLIAFDCRSDNGGSEIHVGSPNDLWWLRRTFDPSDDVRPSWSHDGKWVYFGSNRGGRGWQIWKVPAAAGPAVQVTQGGGREAFADDRFVYYTKHAIAGIWKIPVEGGEETQVVAEGDQGRWALTDRGLYYLRGNSVIWTAEGNDRRVLTFHEPAAAIRGMTASRDGKDILIVSGDDRNTKIVWYSRRN